MTNDQPSNNRRRGARGPRRAQPKRQTTRGKRIRVEATRRERVDPEMIALCYWLIAQRIVQEAGDESAGAAPRKAPDVSEVESLPDRAGAGSDS